MAIDIDSTQSASLDRYMDHIRRLKRDGKTGVFGAEVSFFHLDLVERLTSFFDVFRPDRTRFFYLTRRDLVAQTVSLHKAINTQVWRQVIDESLPYDECELLRWMEHILRQEDGFERMFEASNLRPTRLVYEDLIEAGPERVCRFFCDALGVEFKGTPKGTIVRFETAQDEEFAARFADSGGFEWLRQRRLGRTVNFASNNEPSLREATGTVPRRAREFNRKIFVLGDSRTGTKALANYFRRNGLEARHYFMDAAQQISPPHEHHKENWRRFKAFLAEDSSQAFSDYPTRSFYRELFHDRPEDYFILTTRKDTPTWQRSMETFFGKRKVQLDLPKLAQYYEDDNEAIKILYGQSRKFLHICIDDDSQENSARLAEFLGFDPTIMLAREHRSTSLDMAILSKRADFFGEPVGDVVDYVRLGCRDSQTLPSSSGWLYLINESDNFLDYLYGKKQWSASERKRALEIVSERVKNMTERGARYRKFIVPEKYIIYPEHLPSVLAGLSFEPARPAVELSRHEDVIYLNEYLIDAKSHGALYFRTDSRPTWLGGFLIYRRIVEVLTELGDPRLGDPVSLETLDARLEAYEGDLMREMRVDQRRELEDIWRPYFPENFHDHEIMYSLGEKARRARRVETPRAYQEGIAARETLVFEQKVPTGPKAVILRDSTADFSVDLLAEHFSRSVFIWNGSHLFDYVLDQERPDYVIQVMAERFVSACSEHVSSTNAAPGSRQALLSPLN